MQLRRLLPLLAVLFALLAPGAPAATSYPTAHRYQTGQAVKNVQWVISGHSPAVLKVHTYYGPITGNYGKRTTLAVRRAKYALGYPTRLLNGEVAGGTFVRYIKGEQTRPLSYRITAGARRWQSTAKPDSVPLPPRVQVLVRDAKHLIERASLVHYSQARRMQIVVGHLAIPPLTRAIYEDCSSSTTGLYWLARLADPNGLGYNGFGFTGTQANHGRTVWRLGQSLARLLPGDLIFYGPYPHRHVTMYLGAGRVFSHGSEAGPYNLPALYRPDAAYARRYADWPTP